MYKKLYPNGSHNAVLYSLPKVHKNGTPMRPICSAIGTSTYELRKFVADIIKPAASNALGTDLENTFQFVKQIREKDISSNLMVSFDVRSLFTNIPLRKTIAICLDRLYRSDPSIRPGIPEKTLKKMLELCVCDNTFLFNGKVYKQIDGVAMGSSLGPLLANIYMAHLEEHHFFQTALDINPSFYRRYVDDTFCLFENKNQVQRFLEYINSIDDSIQFDVEYETNDSLSFLDTIISRSSSNMYPDVSTKIKSTDKGLLYNCTSFIPDEYKRNLISCLVFRVFNIASSYKLFHIDKETLKNKFLSNGFPAWLFDSLVGKFLNDIYDPPPTSYAVPKVKVVIVLPYLGYISIYVSRKLRRLINKFFPMIDLRIIYSRGHSIRNMFPYKDKLPLKCRSGIVYHIQCDNCEPSVAYIGKTFNTLYERFYGSNGHLHPSTKRSALLEHIMQDVSPNCGFDIDKIKILDSCNNDLKLRFAESIHIKLGNQSLNTQERSIPLNII